MIQAITTTFINDQKQRTVGVQAICEGGIVTLPYQSKLNLEEGRELAASALLKKMGWEGTLHRGPVLPSGEQVYSVIPEWMFGFSRWCDDKGIYFAEALGRIAA